MSAEERIRSLPIWDEPPRLEPVLAGRTNRNFIITCGAKRYFARAGQDLARHRISRSAEATCAKIAAAVGIGPALLFGQNGILVTAYIEGSPLRRDALRSDDMLGRIAAILRRLHAAPPPAGLPTFDPACACRFYLARLDDGALTRGERQRIEDILDAAPQLPLRALIHADLIPENFIDDGRQLWLVDWEYAGRGDPATDLAMVAANFDLPPEIRRRLVQSHGQCSEMIVETAEPLVAAREALWCLTQLEISGPQGDLLEYSRSCLARIGIER